ncbi:hypothetical protein FOMPIDRAFT_116914 [Fomitopsis schrenkii]|uniref:Uncharacterized protein n=1 Tax=Fomitopsis schrenkii TaxID=2126942 RepID=S8FCB0_FOMSC|nr:hypothetical protein FOMPIDRAFT_116914 [Fomitopsis schrenkii]
MARHPDLYLLRVVVVRPSTFSDIAQVPGDLPHGYLPPDRAANLPDFLPRPSRSQRDPLSPLYRYRGIIYGFNSAVFANQHPNQDYTGVAPVSGVLYLSERPMNMCTPLISPVLYPYYGLDKQPTALAAAARPRSPTPQIALSGNRPTYANILNVSNRPPTPHLNFARPHNDPRSPFRASRTNASGVVTLPNPDTNPLTSTILEEGELANPPSSPAEDIKMELEYVSPLNLDSPPSSLTLSDQPSPPSTAATKGDLDDMDIEDKLDEDTVMVHPYRDCPGPMALGRLIANYKDNNEVDSSYETDTNAAAGSQISPTKSGSQPTPSTTSQQPESAIS